VPDELDGCQRRSALCTTLCDDYADGAAVMIKSFFENNTWYTGDIIVLCWGKLSPEQKLRIGSLSPKIEFREIDETQYSKARTDGHRLWNYIPASRFAMFKFAEYDRLVYLDADVVVMGDIRELFETATSFGACRLMPGEGMELRDKGGFNAGVLTIGSEFISEGVHDSLMRIATAKPWSGNQVVLNLRFGENVEYLPHNFNVTTDQLTDITFGTAKILHFVGEEKPWHSTCRISKRRIARLGEPLAARALAVWDHWASKIPGMAD
jgi:lipopolysaccharide biosynthesis glycosyltransferase